MPKRLRPFDPIAIPISISISVSILILSVASTTCSVETLDEPKARDAAPGRQDKVEPPKEDPAAAAPPTASDSAGPPSFEVPEHVEATEPEVELESAGAEPRQPLRLAPSRGDVVRRSLTMKMKVAMRLGSQNIPPKAIPDVETVLLSKVGSVSEEEIRYSVRTESASSDGGADASARVREAVDTAVEGLRKAEGTVVVSARGRTIRFDVDVPGEQDANLRPTLEGFRQAFAQMFPWLPEEPVGIGARWTSITHAKQNGLHIQQTARYELVERTGQRVTLELSFDQRAIDTAGADDVVPGATFEVEGFGGQGRGTVVLDLSEVLPASGRVESTTTTQSRVALGGKSQPVGMRVELELELAPR
jgi:hypothetical protein